MNKFVIELNLTELETLQEELEYLQNNFDIVHNMDDPRLKYVYGNILRKLAKSKDNE